MAHSAPNYPRSYSSSLIIVAATMCVASLLTPTRNYVMHIFENRNFLLCQFELCLYSRLDFWLIYGSRPLRNTEMFTRIHGATRQTLKESIEIGSEYNQFSLS